MRKTSTTQAVLRIFYKKKRKNAVKSSQKDDKKRIFLFFKVFTHFI